jgi:hypothetical protein
LSHVVAIFDERMAPRRADAEVEVAMGRFRYA